MIPSLRERIESIFRNHGLLRMVQQLGGHACSLTHCTHCESEKMIEEILTCLPSVGTRAALLRILSDNFCGTNSFKYAIGNTKLHDDLLTWAGVAEEPRWCEHMTNVDMVTLRWRDGAGTDNYGVTGAIKFCPICAAPRPTEARE